MLGYTGSISAEKLEELNKENKESIYSVDDQIGISGLESTYEDYLRGTKGAVRLRSMVERAVLSLRRQRRIRLQEMICI